MQTLNNTTATLNNEVVNPSNHSTDEPQSRRLWESREMWTVVFDHTVTLLTLALKGEKLPDDPREGFAFGKGAFTKNGKAVKLVIKDDQPHIVAYATGLLAGFGSYATKKATKALAEVGIQNEVLADSMSRMAIASQLAEACRLAKRGDGINRLNKVEAKQGRTLILAVAAALSEAKPTETEADATPKGVEKKPKNSTQKSTPKGGKAKTAKAEPKKD